MYHTTYHQKTRFSKMLYTTYHQKTRYFKMLHTPIIKRPDSWDV